MNGGLRLPITEKACAKINLALHVVARRTDGYHMLDSLVAFAEFGDLLTFESAPQLTLEVVGPFAHELADVSCNIAIRAAEAMLDAWPGQIRAAAIRLEKNLPVASGIGGGSADAAGAMRGLMRLSDVSGDQAKLERLALQLGADVPVCLYPRACRMGGIGDKVERLAKFPKFPAILINPRNPMRTPDVFAQLAIAKGSAAMPAMPDLPKDTSPSGWVSWLSSCRNDLQQAAISQAPQIGTVLDALGAMPGYVLGRMSGSGATCFGLYETRNATAAAASRIRAEHPDWWVRPTLIG